MIVEKHVRYATEVDSVQDAFKFIMSYIVQDTDHPAGIRYEVSIRGVT